MTGILDFRSDASSLPTPEIRRAMAGAEVGNDDFGEDPSINRLEREAALLLAKEAALLVHSGTMANLAAVMSHTRPGDLIVCGRRFHVFDFEAEAMRRVVGVDFVLLEDDTRGGRTRLQFDGIETRGARLLCLENSVNTPGGTLIEPAHLQELAAWARTRGMSVHLDGARLLNACLGLGVEPCELAACADTVSLALSKGLGAPCGALLAGPAELIGRARHNRWMLGGNWKQGGVIAAAALAALDTMRDRLRQDHENARRLAVGLDAIDGLAVDLDQVVTNILHMRVTDDSVDLQVWSDHLAAQGVRTGEFRPERFCRWVTHAGIQEADIDRVLRIVEAHPLSARRRQE